MVEALEAASKSKSSGDPTTLFAAAVKKTHMRGTIAAIAMMRHVCTTMVIIECYCVAIEDYLISLVSCW